MRIGKLREITFNRAPISTNNVVYTASGKDIPKFSTNPFIYQFGIYENYTTKTIYYPGYIQIFASDNTFHPRSMVGDAVQSPNGGYMHCTLVYIAE